MEEARCSCIWEKAGTLTHQQMHLSSNTIGSSQQQKALDKKEEAPKQPKSTFKSVDPTLKLETWILKNSGLKLLYYHILKLDQNSLKFKFPTSKLDQQTWMLNLVALELLPFCQAPFVAEINR